MGGAKESCQKWDSNPRLQGRLRPERSALDRSAILTRRFSRPPPPPSSSSRPVPPPGRSRSSWSGHGDRGEVPEGKRVSPPTSKGQPGSYGPVSLTPTPGKVVEPPGGPFPSARLTGVGSHCRHNVPPPRGIRLGDVCVHLLLDSNSPFLRDLPPAASAEVLRDPLVPCADDLQCCGDRPVHHCLRNMRSRRPTYILAAVGLQPESCGILLCRSHDDRLWGEHLLQLPRLERVRQQCGH
ncbi:plasmolipin isoform X3 [Buteo buteo]